MNAQIQEVSRLFFEAREQGMSPSVVEQRFKSYWDKLYPMAYQVSMNILRDHDHATANVSDTFMKIYNSKTFIFDNTKSHLSYVYTIASNNAKMMINKLNKQKKLVQFESNLMGDAQDEARENTLDYLMHKNSNPDEINPEHFEHDFLHNNTKHQFIKYVEIIEKHDNAQIIKEAEGICYDENGVPYIDEDKKVPYEVIKERHGLNTSGAVKTKMFRARKQIKAELMKDLRFFMMIDGGHEDGEMNLYCEKTNRVTATITIKDGVIHGKAKKFDVTGNLVQECNYNKGTLDGEYKEFHSGCMNGEPQLKLKGYYQDGTKIGEWTRFDISGEVEEKVDYDPDEGAGLLEFRDIALYMTDSGEIREGDEIEFCDFAFAEQDI